MNHLFDRRTDAALRQLDPAAGSSSALTPAERKRSDATLARILATDPRAGDARTSATASPRRRVSRRMLVPAGIAATAIALAVPTFTGSEAYATWTPEPKPLSATQAAKASAACVEQTDSSAGGRPLLAERRGEWAYVLVPTSPKTESSCVLPLDEAMKGSEANGRWFGGSGDKLGGPAPTPRQVQVGTLGTGSTKEGLLSWMEGRVGRDVRKIVVTTPTGKKVTASVANGRFAAWWPAGKDRIDNPEISGAVILHATLRDGSTIRVR